MSQHPNSSLCTPIQPPQSYAEMAPYLERWPARSEYRRRFPHDHPPTQGYYHPGQAPYYETHTPHMSQLPIFEPTQYMSLGRAMYSYRRVAPEELFWPHQHSSSK